MLNGSLPSGFVGRTWSGTITETGPRGGVSTFDTTIRFVSGGIGDVVGVSNISLIHGNNGCDNATYAIQLQAIFNQNVISTHSIRSSATGNCNPAENEFVLLPNGQLEVKWWVQQGNAKQQRTGYGILS